MSAALPRIDPAFVALIAATPATNDGSVVCAARKKISSISPSPRSAWAEGGV